MLRNWQTQKTVLWLVTVDFSDDAYGPGVTVLSVSSDPPGVVLRRVGERNRELGFDLTGATFSESAPEGFSVETFERFLLVLLRDGRNLLFAEERG
jgi:hypothetical protein